MKHHQEKPWLKSNAGIVLFLILCLFQVAFAQTQQTQQTTTGTMQLTQQTTQEQNIQPPFIDVEIGNKYFVAIAYLKQHGLIKGYDDGTFRPEKEINRAEALKVLLMAIAGKAQPTAKKIPFTDIKYNDWFYTYVFEAYNNNLIKGYPDGLFHAERNINLAEALKICLLREGNPLPTQITDPPYSDVPVDAWYAPYAKVARDRTLALVGRTDGALHGETVMTRGAFVSLIYKIIQTATGSSSFIRATWYGDEFANWGTASGEKFDPLKFTAAHKTLPFGTGLLVTNLANGEHTEVVVNDRGPYAPGMDLDLSRAAFEAISSLGAGIINVEFTEIPNVDFNF